MNPDLEKRVPREILEELIEEGTEAFRGILEKLSTWRCSWKEASF